MRRTKVRTKAQLVRTFGEMWARNPENLRSEKIPKRKKGGQGVYILFDGSMPVYVGKGNIRNRLRGAQKSRRRGQLWDRFSWYVLKNKGIMHDVEALLLRMLPTYLLALNRQKGKLTRAKRVREDRASRTADYISRKVVRRG